MDTILPSTPQEYKQLIKTSFNLYRASFTTVLILSVLLSITAFIPRLLSVLTGQDILANVPPLSPHRIWLLLINLGSLIFLIAILWRIHCFIRGQHEPLIQDLTQGVKKVLYVFIAGILQSVIVFGFFMIFYGLVWLLNSHQLLFSNQLAGLIATIVIFMLEFYLLLYISTLFIFFIPLIAIESKNIFTSLEGSIKLAWNHWWRVFSVQVTPWLCYFLFLVIIRYALHLHVHIYFMYQPQNSLVSSLIQLVTFAIFIPWVASLLLVQLNDLELRRQAN